MARVSIGGAALPRLLAGTEKEAIDRELDDTEASPLIDPNGSPGSTAVRELGPRSAETQGFQLDRKRLKIAASGLFSRLRRAI